MILKEGLLEEDEARYLASYNHSFKGLIHGKPPKRGFEHGGNLRRACDCTWPVVVTFVLSLAAFLLPRWLAALCVVVIVGILCRLKGSLGVLLLSVLVGKIHKNHHERAVIYYRHHLWEHYWQQYSEVSLLKAYRGIDPSVVPGTQIQDAGAVDFVSSAGIDSEHAGNAGRTYCIAPIVTNGTMLHNIGGAPRYGSYDYFAVGVDCCSCPDINFRCGAWRHPWAEGGIRSTDLEARPFYRLAVEAWASSYRKTAAHPLFFEWVESPGFETAWERWLPEMMESYKESMLMPEASFTESPDSFYGALSDLRPLPSVYLLKASQRVSRIYEKLDLGLYEEAFRGVRGAPMVAKMKEDNPFKLPSDDQIFAMREEERQRRAEERERVKHQHVWEKVTAASRHSRTRRIDDIDDTCGASAARPDVRPEGLGCLVHTLTSRGAAGVTRSAAGR
eukprot:g1236.t1